MSWLIFGVAVCVFIGFWWLIFEMDIRASVHRDRHCHEYKPVGYGGAGWSLYRCECGAEEVDA